jgi:hypothetical protein
MKDRVFLWLGNAAVPVRLAAGAAAGLSVGLAVMVGLGASAGIGGLAGGAALVVGFYGVGITIQAWGRAKLRAQAFVWQGSVTEADPISHFMVEPARHASLDRVPPYVPRNTASAMEKGLHSERLVVVGGERVAGKSRLIYETLLPLKVEVLVSNLASVKDGDTDPLTVVLRDRRGLPRRKRRRVIVIRDYVSRMLAGHLNADILRSWLDRYPETAIIITLGSPDITRINDRGEEYTRELARLRRQGRPVQVNRQLSRRELKKAEQLFPHLAPRELEYLPAYRSVSAVVGTP